MSCRVPKVQITLIPHLMMVLLTLRGEYTVCTLHSTGCDIVIIVSYYISTFG